MFVCSHSHTEFSLDEAFLSTYARQARVVGGCVIPLNYPLRANENKLKYAALCTDYRLAGKVLLHRVHTENIVSDHG